MNKDSIEYRMISSFYNTQVAQRSQVPLINHIDEGLIVLDRISATDDAKKVFCIHPLLQADDDLKNNYTWVVGACRPKVLMLAMEYRSVANEYLSLRDIKDPIEIRLSPLFEVDDMLVADKVQNFKDFMMYHHGTHPRSEKLYKYFQNWLDPLEN